MCALHAAALGHPMPLARLLALLRERTLLSEFELMSADFAAGAANRLKTMLRGRNSRALGAHGLKIPDRQERALGPRSDGNKLDGHVLQVEQVGLDFSRSLRLHVVLPWAIPTKPK